MKLSLITSTKPEILTKRYCLDGQNQLQKFTSAHLVEGQAHTVEVETLPEFAEVLAELQSNTALSYGIARQQTIKVFSEKAYKRLGSPTDAIMRKREHFHFPAGPGVLLLDYDPREGCKVYSRDEVLGMLAEAAPDLANAGKVWWVSSSSFIFNGDEQLNGLRGQRVYVGVMDATDIPRAGKVLFERLWLKGHGYYAISKAARLLVRGLVDAGVWQPERLDFAAGAKCTPPLRQDRGTPLVIDGPLLDTRQALPDLTAAERASLLRLQEAAKADAEPERQIVRAAYIETRAAELVGTGADDTVMERARAIFKRALDSDVLTGEFPIQLADGSTVTVGEILDDPNRYHHMLTRDPLEPDYNGGHTVGKIYLFSGRPTLHSFAHGGRTFKLIRQPSKVELVRGRTSDAVDTTLEILATRPDLFSYGDSVATVRNDKLSVTNEYSLAHYLGGVIQYWNWKKVGDNLAEVNEDPPPKLVRTLMSMAGNLKPLDSVVTAPVILPDCRLLSTSGYDAKSRLYLVCNDLVPVPENPTKEQVRSALNELMLPFNDFPFVTALDRAVMLAALLTAIERPALPTAPAFGFDAPVQGSGKTLLARCVGALATGTDPAITPHTAGRDDDETRKRLLTALLGGEGVLLWDNLLGIFDSASMAGLLTSSMFKDRILGQTRECVVPNRLLVLMTGNNMCLGGDMPRRVLMCRIDPKTDQPFAREFLLDPLDYVVRNRQRLVSAGLTLIRGWLESEDYLLGRTAKGRTASFEQWDDLVRQTVAWINRAVAPGQYGDVMDAIMDAQQSDPEQEALLGFLQAMQAAFGSSRVTAKAIVAKCGTPATDYGADAAGVELREAIADLTGGQHFTAKSLGRTLKYRKDRVVRSLVLRQRTDTSNGSGWYVETVASAGRPNLVAVHTARSPA